MAPRPPAKSLPVRSLAPSPLERVSDSRWKHMERAAQAIRALGGTPLTRQRAERLGLRLGVHWSTIYRYRARLAEADESTADAGRLRG